IYSDVMERLKNNIKFTSHQMNVNGGESVTVIKSVCSIRTAVRLPFRSVMISSFRNLHALRQIWARILFSHRFVQKTAKAIYACVIVHSLVRLKIRFTRLFPERSATCLKRKTWTSNMRNRPFSHQAILNLRGMEL